jgi:formiminotetrahydrofolate cyclodeaminase
MGAGLVAMVAGLTIGKKKYAAVEEQMKDILAEAESLRAQLSADVIEDAASFDAVLEAIKMPKDTPEQAAARAEALERATLNAARVPLDTAQRSLRVIALAGQVVADGNLNTISDGASAAAMARAALTAAGTNVRINVNSLADRTPGLPLLESLQQLEQQASEMEAYIRRTLQIRAGFSF